MVDYGQQLLTTTTTWRQMPLDAYTISTSFFVWVEGLSPSQQFFRHVGTFSWVEPILSNEDEVSCSRTQHRAPGEIQPCGQQSGTLPTELTKKTSCSGAVMDFPAGVHDVICTAQIKMTSFGLPSICISNSDLTLRLASCSDPEPRLEHIESISSINIVLGA